MKNKLIIKRFFGFLAVVVIAFFSFVTVFAVDLDGDGIDDEEPVFSVAPTEYVEPEYTEQPTEFVETEPEQTEAPTEYVPTVAEQTDSPTPTEYVYNEPEQTEKQTQNAAPAPVVQETTEFQAPTLAKTISDKQYSTNYTAGIISWICVAVGIIVVAAVLISTKVGGKKI